MPCGKLSQNPEKNKSITATVRQRFLSTILAWYLHYIFEKALIIARLVVAIYHEVFEAYYLLRFYIAPGKVLIEHE